MAKRALRVVKNLGRIPAVAVCTVCGRHSRLLWTHWWASRMPRPTSNSSFMGTGATEKILARLLGGS